MNMEADMLDRIIAVLICVESGGDPAAVGDGGRSIGVLQMSRVAVADYNRLTGRGEEWKAALDAKKARHMARVILRHYAGPPPLPGSNAAVNQRYAEKCARIWNGGPSMRGTDDYAKRFLTEWERQETARKARAR